MNSCSTVKMLASLALLGKKNQLFLSVWILTGSSHISQYASQGAHTSAGYTLVPAQSQVGQGRDVEAVGPQHSSEISIQQFLAVEAPADVGQGGPGTTAQRHATAQLLHHRRRLLGENRHLVWKTVRCRLGMECMFNSTSTVCILLHEPNI